MAKENKKPEARKPKFNYYWVYAIIFVIVILFSQVFGGGLSQPAKTTQWFRFLRYLIKVERTE